MHSKVFLNLCALLAIASIFGKLCDGYQVGKGKFESFNGNRYTEAKSISDNDTKAFFNMNRNRPPAHDTPASPCSCRKLNNASNITQKYFKSSACKAMEITYANRSYFFSHQRATHPKKNEDFSWP